MTESNYTKLELDKILNKLANICSNESSKALALNIQPHTDIKDVKESLKKTLDAYELSIKYGAPAFYDFKDVTPSLKRCRQGGKVSVEDLMDVTKVLRQIQILSDWNSRCEGESTSLDYLFSQVQPVSYLLNKLENSILEDGKFADSASPKLLSIRKKIARAGITLRETLNKMTHDAGIQKYLQDSNITLRDGRYVVPVKAEFRGKVQGLIHDTSATGQTIFIEPVAVVEANNDIRLLEAEEIEEIERIIAEICRDIGENAEVIKQSMETCVKLCVIFAKAEMGIKMKAFAPVISDENIIDLKKARHPLLAAKTAVPIDIELGKAYKILIVTGPNTGGKTVALKTLGLLCLMAMCGLMIPAAEGSVVPVLKNVLCDIGDKQSIEASLSTFSSHMTDIADILNTADENSLVLLDEPGTGTDPVEGAALAESIFEDLRTKGSLCMATTHYQELKIYASGTNGVQNASVEFDENTLKPTYRLLTGSPGKSNAFEICRSLGIPQNIIDHAKTLITVENKRFERAIENLQKTQKALETQKAEIEENRQKTAQLLEETKKIKQELEENKNLELKKAKEKADKIIEKTKADSNALLDELENIKKEKEKQDFGQKVSGAKHTSSMYLNRMYDTANPVAAAEDDDYKLPRELKPGDRVYIVGMNREGIVAGKSENDMVFVQAGIMKTKIKISKLRLMEKGKQMPKPAKTGRQPARGRRGGAAGSAASESRPVRQSSLECDLRGMASDEGVYEMEAFLDHALMSGMHTVTVIHGKGTGVLRDACRKRLRQLPQVKSFRPGVYGEGEDGVTIVELK